MSKRGPIHIITKIKNDEELAPLFDKIITFLKRIEVSNYGSNMKNVFFGTDITNLGLKMKIGKQKNEVVSILKKLFKYGMLEDVSKNGSFKAEKVFYRLSIPQKALDSVVSLQILKEKNKALRNEFCHNFKDDLFRTMLHDFLLLAIERQSNLEEIASEERKNYRHLYQKYKMNKGENNEHYAMKVKELEKELEDQKRINTEKHILLERLKKQVQENQSDDASKMSIEIDKRLVNREIDKALVEYNRLKDDVSNVENKNETLTKHNELLVKKYNELKDATRESIQKQKEQKKTIFELETKLKQVNAHYQKMLQDTSQENEEMLDRVTKRLELEKTQNMEVDEKAKQTEERMEFIRKELIKIQKEISSESTSKESVIMNYSSQSLSEKIANILKQLGK